MKLFFILSSFILIGLLTFRFGNLLPEIALYPYGYFLFIGMLSVLISIRSLSHYKLKDKLSVSEINLKFSIQDVIKNYFIILGLFLSLISFFLHSYFNFKFATLTTDISTLTYLSSVVLLGIGFWRLDLRRQIKLDISLVGKEKIIFFALLICAAGLRFYKFDSIGHLPEDILWSEHSILILQRIIRSPFLFVGDLSTNMPAYPVALFYLITSSMDIAVRVPAILYNLLFLVALFFLSTEMFGKKIGFWALFIATFSIWDIHNGRLAWHNLSTNELLITSSLLFFIRSFKYKSYFNLFLCGFILGLAFNLLYIPALMLGVWGVAVLFYLFYLLWRSSPVTKLVFLGQYVLIMSVVLFVTIAPTLVKIYKYPNQSINRHEQFLVHNIQEASMRTNSLSYYIEQLNIVNSNFGFNPVHYSSDGPWGPALNAVIVFFFCLGLAYSLTRFRSPSFFILITTWVFMYIPVIVLFMTISVWRLISFAPIVFIFTSIGIVVSVDLIVKTIPIFQKSFFRNLIILGIVLLIGFYVKEDYRQYFYFRTVEDANHIFQICKLTEIKLKKLSVNSLWVPNDECGRTLYGVFNKEILINFYESIDEPIAGGANTIILERLQPPYKSNISEAQNTKMALQTEIRDDKSFEKIRLYYLNQ